MGPHLLFFGVIVACASLLALLEVQIEGSHGWASALPTWRVENRWTRRLLASRALTGYHVYLHALVLVIIHLPFALSLASPSLRGELRIVSFWIFFWILEDFLWFVFNPFFGLRRFTAREAWWHADSWWLFMPREYWIFTPIAIALYVASWRL